jgi:signal peptidase I
VTNTEPTVDTDSNGETEPADSHRRHGKSLGHVSGEWIGILVGAFILAVVIKTYVAQTFYIPSVSMERTLLVNDRVLVNKLAYKFSDVHRGDVVVFKRPPLEPDRSIKDLIKRVIAVPGETVESRNGVVYVNGKELEEPYLAAGMPTNDLPPTVVQPGTYFVMGDNRVNSFDSRRFQAIDEDLLVGRADVRIWPLGRLGGL